MAASLCCTGELYVLSLRLWFAFPFLGGVFGEGSRCLALQELPLQHGH